MDMKRWFCVIIVVGIAFFSCQTFNAIDLQEEDLTQYVNPFVGTDGHGHTFPGAVMPFGMVQLSPDTRLTGWDGCSAYHYSDSIVYGFSHTHLSGTGCSDYGDVLLMPMCGHYSISNQADDSNAYPSKFSHQDEIAEPGYYAVQLQDENIHVELTVSPRVGMHQYTFQAAGKRYVVLDLEHRDVVLEAGLRQVSQTRFTGLRHSHAWADKQFLFFAMDFSSPVKIANYHLQQDSLFEPEKPVFVFEVLDTTIQVLKIKVALSQVSEQGAIGNLEKEIPDWNFEQVKANARQVWNKELNKIIVKGGTEEQRKIFYTSLYHAFIHPTLAQDVDGSYRGTDLQTHATDQFTYYTVFSLWDTYRAAHPLYTIVQQEKTADFVKTFLCQYQQGGQLPMWELSSNETKCMIGYHAVPPIVDAYNKGLIDTSLQQLALEAMIASATCDELGKKEYEKFGFLPIEAEHESVSKTLEYAYDDWCIAQLANSIGNKKVYQEYLIRAQSYKHLFDKESSCMRPRRNGAWKEDFDPSEVDNNFTEANAWQYSFYVPQDMNTFIGLMGGNKTFEAKLDALFAADEQTHGRHQVDITGLIGQYAHGNEPSHHIAYLYNYCGKPAKTQKLVRQIMEEMYQATPAGCCGNEDCGQMSAWYVLSAMGFYPVNPANGIFDMGSPIFDTIVITLDNGKKCSIVAHNNSKENLYIEKMKVNGKNYKYAYIDYKTIADGGRIDCYMTDDSTTQFATNEKHIYYSQIDEYQIVPSPFTNSTKRTFYDSTWIVLDCYYPDAKIYYSINNNDYQEYTKPILIKEDASISAYSSHKGMIDSKPIYADYVKIADDRKVNILSQYSSMYSAGGDEALIDRLRGGSDFRTGEWQGYQGQDFVAVVDLLTPRNITAIETGFIQDTRSWIILPKYVDFYVSTDNIHFKKVAHLTHSIADNDYKSQIYHFEQQLDNCQAQYVKVYAKYYGPLPKWHLGYGGESYLFIDEIDVKTKD